MGYQPDRWKSCANLLVLLAVSNVLANFLTFPLAEATPTNPIQNVIDPFGFAKICQNPSTMSVFFPGVNFTAACSTLLSASTDKAIECKPLPPRDPKGSEPELNTLLSKGVKQMNAQIANKLDKSSNSSRAIFILGNTGSGKTTLTQILSGDLNRLYATKTESGNLVIIDDGNRIGAPTTTSKTLVPEYVVNPETGIAFWDCPGFDDNRGPDMDIAAMYFLKHAMDSTNEAKFLLTVSHSSVKSGNDRNDFDLLVTHVIRLLKELPKLKLSIGLVVTKVGSFSQDSGAFLNDNQILAQITEFLATYVRTKRALTQTLELQRKIELVEGILENSQDRKLFFVRSPTKCGTLGQMESILETRKQIADMYNTSLVYSSVSPNDFQLTLKSDTTLKLKTEYIPRIVTKIRDEVNKTIIDFKLQFEKKFYGTLTANPEKSFDFLNRTVHVLNTFLKNGANTLETNNISASVPFSQQTQNLFSELDFNINCTNVLPMKESETQLMFFEMMTNNMNKVETRRPNWVIPFSNLAKESQKLREFYEFCANTKLELTNYRKQKLLSQIFTHNRTTITIDPENILYFLSTNHLVLVSTKMFEIWSSRNTRDKLFLGNVVNERIPTFSVKCENSSIKSDMKHLILVGRNVKLSDIQNKSNWPNSCVNKPIKEFSIFGMEMVYIDIDIYPRGNETQLQDSSLLYSFPNIGNVEQVHISIIAPVWKVIGNRKIILHGFQPPDLPKAATGRWFGYSGDNGIDGGQGGHAGSFFGVYSEMENGELLYISANGGNGGNGQEGGNGRDGINGGDANRDFYPNSLSESLFPFYIPPPSYNVESGLFYGKNLRWADSAERVVSTESQNKWHTNFGRSDGFGGNGGNGGRGGSPGRPGNVELICLLVLGSGRISTSTKVGDWGKPGLGGKGGFSGNDGRAHSCRFEGLQWKKCYIQIYSGRRSGTYGRSGTIGLKDVLNTSVNNSSLEVWKLLVKYKSRFLGEDFKLVQKFLVEMDSNPTLRETYDLTSYAAEIKMVEEKFFEVGNMATKYNESLLISYYESFLYRLNHLGKTRSSSQQDELALNIIYSTVFSKLVALRASENYLNVIKTTEYFDTILSSMETLKTDQKIFNNLVKNHKQFKNKLNSKIKEAEYFLATTVNSAINEVQKELNETNHQLSLEINYHLKAAKETFQIAQERQRKIKAAVTKNALSGLFGVVATACEFLGPKGLIASAAINAGIGLVNTLHDSPKSKEIDAVSTTPLAALRATMSSFNGENGSLAYGEAVKSVANIVNDIKDANEISELVEEAERAVRQIKVKKQQFYDEFMPQLFSFYDNVNSSTSQIAGQSRSALSVKKWQVKGLLRNMRGYVQKFTKEFVVGEEFQSRFDSLDEAIVLMIDLYDHIERYEEKKDLVDYMTNIIHPTESQTLDPDLQISLTKLKFMISANLFMAEYQKGMHAFKQWAFPFAGQYLKDMKKSPTPTSLDDVANSYTEKTKFLKVQLEKYKATTVTGDDALMISLFTSQVVSSKPFYIWANSKWQNTIKQLLNGQRIHVKADVDMNDQLSKAFFRKKAAMKFKSIELSIKTHNSSRQADLDQKLNHFHVELTHSGISLYKALGQHFIMYDRNQTYRYSYERIGNNSHVAVNAVKYKEDGPGTDFLMSPYTWWTFQLTDVVPGDIGFSDLEEFGEEVDLELQGVGLYLDESRMSEEKLNSLSLSDYYEVYDPTTKWLDFDKEINVDTCSAGD